MLGPSGEGLDSKSQFRGSQVQIEWSPDELEAKSIRRQKLFNDSNPSNVLAWQHTPPVCPYSCMADWKCSSLLLPHHLGRVSQCRFLAWEKIKISESKCCIILVMEGLTSAHLALESVRVCWGRLYSNCTSLKETKCSIIAKVRRKI